MVFHDELLVVRGGADRAELVARLFFLEGLLENKCIHNC